ncbi:SH3 domain-containing protein [Flavobacterium sp. HBTb2-11-1]|uniref:SH3 domain-containing protein n=1 Tax=Flavobacterium sp. HBTb2-11-1 TaxID=2692212 RepID=UPI00136A4011|nr:SH3 domain-containing protein [Flavobacterium sp. HBTb2-11-1]MXO05617.1 SH3 domain-containing protein [Flavobacterium sp. HBTb2-11-1]
MRNLRITLFVLISILILSCENKTAKIEKNQPIVLEKEGNDLENIKFSELFNEGSIIKFTPNDLKKTNSPNELEFKRKLELFEKKYLDKKGFDSENLIVLVNNETFTNSEHFIDSSWLKYFVQKYDLGLESNNVMDAAISQEDLNAVKIIVNTGYILCKDEILLALQTKENSIINKKINKDNNGYDENGDLIFYDDKESKAEEIYKFLKKNYSYKIFDKDGYTNLRDDAMNSAYILAEIKSGTPIEILDNKDQKWLYIQTNDGQKGYVHRSRIIN